MVVRYQIYDSFDDMPADILKECGRMGYKDDGILRYLVHSYKRPDIHYNNSLTLFLHKAIVMIDRGYIVGWSALYQYGLETEYGMWINKECRKNGYGTKLIKKSKTLFKNYNPGLFGWAEDHW